MMDDEILSLQKLLKIKLIRESILRNLPSLHDIGNLAKSCKWINYFIEIQPINRNMIFYEDKQKISIKTNDNYVFLLHNAELEDIEFEKDKKSIENLSIIKNFCGEILFNRNSIITIVDVTLSEFRGRSYRFFVKKFVQELNIHCEERKNADILQFFLNSRFNDNCDLIINALKFIKHDNITQISIPAEVFCANSSKYRGTNYDIFEGLPNLNKLEIFNLSFSDDQYIQRKLEVNKNILKNLLVHLSKKNNPTLVLKFFDVKYKIIVDCVEMVINILKKHKIKITINVDICISMLTGGSNNISLTEKCLLYPIKKYINSTYFLIKSCGEILCVMKNLQYYENLKILMLEFQDIENMNEFETLSQSTTGTLSLKKCTKLKKIRFKFNENIDINDPKKLKIFVNLLTYISSLMPETVEILKLINVSYFNSDVARIINQFMPNIKLFVMDCQSYGDSDSLIPLKNLDAFFSYQTPKVNIPSNIKLLAIENKEDPNNSPDNSKLMQLLSERYLKRIKDSDGRYIYFNDIKLWDLYKNLLQSVFF